MTSISNKIKKIWIETFDLIAFLVFVFGIILFIRLFIWTPYTVVWSSMLPTFEQGDRIVVEKISQRFWTLKRGDVIVFVPPGKNIPFIKRIIGLPWETVKFVDNTTYICNDTTQTGTIQSRNGQNCFALQEDYLAPETRTVPQKGRDEFPVENGYFVMGDNRGHTTDSLHCFHAECFKWAGYVVPNNYMIGRVLVRLLPSWKTF